MTLNELTDALAARLTEVVKDYWFTDESGDERAPQVVTGWLPAKRSNGQEDFPYVLVRPTEGIDNYEDSVGTVRILVGMRDESLNSQGYRDVLNVIQRIRNSLMADPMLQNRFQLKWPVRWQLFEEQPWPEWIGEITTEWTIPQTLRLLSDVEADGYGETI